MPWSDWYYKPIGKASVAINCGIELIKIGFLLTLNDLVLHQTLNVQHEDKSVHISFGWI